MTSRAYTIFRDSVVLPVDSSEPQRIGNGLSGESGPVESALILDHGKDAIEHLLPDYNEKPRLEAVIQAAGDQITQLEGQLAELQLMRALSYAYGFHVDILGAIVGEPRQGRTDAVYKTYIRIRIIVNRSKGKLGDLYAILMLAFTGMEFAIYEYYPKALDVVLLGDIDPIIPSEFVQYLLRAKPAGTRLKLGYSHEALANTLILAGTNVTGNDTDGTNYAPGNVLAGLVG